MMHRRILVVALPITVITAIGLASIVAVGAIGGTSPSGRATSGPGAACGAVTGTAAGLDTRAGS